MCRPCAECCKAWWIFSDLKDDALRASWLDTDKISVIKIRERLWKIVFRIPCSKLVECDGGYWFRTFRFRPKVVPGDRIFFVKDGPIKGYGVIFGVSELSQAAECDFTGIQWGTQGGYIVKYRDWKWLKTPVQHRGFQGLRYIDRLPGLKEKLLAEMR